MRRSIYTHIRMTYMVYSWYQPGICLMYWQASTTGCLRTHVQKSKDNELMWGVKIFAAFEHASSMNICPYFLFLSFVLSSFNCCFVTQSKLNGLDILTRICHSHSISICFFYFVSSFDPFSHTHKYIECLLLFLANGGWIK